MSIKLHRSQRYLEQYITLLRSRSFQTFEVVREAEALIRKAGIAGIMRSAASIIDLFGVKSVVEEARKFDEYYGFEEIYHHKKVVYFFQYNDIIINLKLNGEENSFDLINIFIGNIESDFIKEVPVVYKSEESNDYVHSITKCAYYMEYKRYVRQAVQRAYA